MDLKAFKVYRVFKVAVSIKLKVYKDFLERRALKVFKAFKGRKVYKEHKPLKELRVYKAFKVFRV